jgi:hypothetical protein
MLAFDSDPTSTELDLERRRQLRIFLIECRSRIAPADIGLPRTDRRRVPGLRRAEVAEAVGVTTEWYRAFERGTAASVSPRFVSRIAKAFCLTSTQELKLFHLAFAELYRL